MEGSVGGAEGAGGGFVGVESSEDLFGLLLLRGFFVGLDEESVVSGVESKVFFTGMIVEIAGIGAGVEEVDGCDCGSTCSWA